MSDIRGFKQLSKKLSQLEDKTARKITRRGAAKFAQVVRKEMKKNAPKKTGTLAKNMKYKITKINSGGWTAHIGAFGDGFYGRFIEKGTKKHALTKKGRVISINGAVKSNVIHPGQRARPFIEKSFNAKKELGLKEAGKIMFNLMVKA